METTVVEVEWLEMTLVPEEITLETYPLNTEHVVKVPTLDPLLRG